MACASLEKERGLERFHRAEVHVLPGIESRQRLERGTIRPYRTAASSIETAIARSPHRMVYEPSIFESPGFPVVA